MMKLLSLITYLFLLPGDIVRKSAGITLEQDGGILRSFVNMVFWGVFLTVVVFGVM